MEVDEEFCLDEARDTLFTLQKACERHAAALGKVVEVLNSKQPDDEWLLDVLDEGAKGMSFHQQQIDLFAVFHARASAYVEAVRNEANLLALQELAGGSGQPDGSEEGGGDLAVPTAGKSQRRKSSKIVHPELLKFKLEKQAKILGKYGGMPALGAGCVLPRLQRDAILKATGSPAAREIHYSKVENKDAAKLVEVMRFKARKAQEDSVNGGSPAPSPWQAELTAKTGKSALDGTDQRDQVTPSTHTHTVYAEELGGVLQLRQAALEEALAAQSQPTPTADAGRQISAEAQDELADKLRKRQAMAKQMEEQSAAAVVEAAEAELTPTVPAWSNPAAPFGTELTAALQRRAAQQRRTSSNGDGGSSGGDAESGTSASKPPSTPDTAHRARLPATAALTTAAATCFVTPVEAVRRGVPAGPAAAAALGTPLASAAGQSSGQGLSTANELQEKLWRRRSAVDAQVPSQGS